MIIVGVNYALHLVQTSSKSSLVEFTSAAHFLSETKLYDLRWYRTPHVIVLESIICIVAIISNLINRYLFKKSPLPSSWPTCLHFLLLL